MSDEPRIDPAAFDAYAPPAIAARVQTIGVKKASTDTLTLLVLATLGGAFIALGATFYLFVRGGMADPGLARLLGGVAFSTGLVLVVVAGAELFTGNNLVAMAWASGAIPARALVRSWMLVLAGNLVGAAGTALLVHVAGVLHANDDLVRLVRAVGHAKASLGWVEAFVRGVLCNALVCLAVWLTLAGRSVTDKILAVVLPVAAFVACGFEHSIANAFFLPLAWLQGAADRPGFVEGAARNLIAVTAGNLAGGTLLVAGVYWVAYLRPGRTT